MYRHSTLEPKSKKGKKEVVKPKPIKRVAKPIRPQKKEMQIELEEEPRKEEMQIESEEEESWPELSEIQDEKPEEYLKASSGEEEILGPTNVQSEMIAEN